MKPKRFAVILGARPNFVKAAPFFLRAKEYPELKFDLIHTGQHYDENMSKIFFDDMQIPKPDIHLDTRKDSSSTTLGLMFSEVLKTVGEGSYDGVIVFGDIDSALLGGIAAAKYDIKLVHVEAGLRSHDRRMPEEKNRILIDHLADILFTTEPVGEENLILEDIERDKIHYVGNIMIESIERFKHLTEKSTVLSDLNLQEQDYFAVTIHRPENTDNSETFNKILAMLNELAKEHTLVFPVHPGTKSKMAKLGYENLLETMKLIEPLGYLDFMKLTMSSKGVITDSGGIQEEASHLGIPCATIRDNTERPITLTHGTNKLFPLADLNAGAVLEHLTSTDCKPGQIPLWDKEVSKRILDVLQTV